jgi:hypothetical protein
LWFEGREVFRGEGATEVLYKIVHEEPVRPSERTELPIPSDLEALVLACLGKQAASRPTAGDLARSLA